MKYTEKEPTQYQPPSPLSGETTFSPKFSKGGGSEKKMSAWGT